MKISKITTAMVSEYLRLDTDSPATVQPLMDAAKSFIRTYTGLDDEEIDKHEDFYIVLMILCQDMYDTRTLTVDKSNINRVIQTILGSHCINYM